MREVKKKLIADMLLIWVMIVSNQNSIEDMVFERALYVGYGKRVLRIKVVNKVSITYLSVSDRD